MNQMLYLVKVKSDVHLLQTPTQFCQFIIAARVINSDSSWKTHIAGHLDSITHVGHSPNIVLCINSLITYSSKSVHKAKKDKTCGLVKCLVDLRTAL
jgi:hypothetical protein